MTPLSPSIDPAFPALRRALAGRYDLEEVIGRGGMGVVYRARERALDRAVAIKVLTPDLSVDAACRQRFLREARTAAGLSHPHIVPVFAVDEPGQGEFVMFAMAHVAGETLAARVARLGAQAPRDVARLLREIGSALAYAHGRGVVHRDVKPDNILIDEATGRALLSDFGIALVRREGGSARPSSVIGTAAFMSPEQALGGPVDRRSDLYSLGVVAYYALAGRLPFEAPNDTALLARHVADPAPPLADVAPHVPARLARVVDRCLAKDPWARFPDASALVRAVSAAIEPPPPPLALRAFLRLGAHLIPPGAAHVAFVGLTLLPATLAAWLYATDVRLRIGTAAGLIAASFLPLWIAVRRVRQLIVAGHRRADLVAALESARAWRLEELAFVYGNGPAPFERILAWLSRMSVVVAAAAVLIPADSLPLRWETAATAAAVALFAAMLARARTERRTDPRGARRLRLWRGMPGRWLFALAGARPLRDTIVRLFDRTDTHAPTSR